MLVNEVWNLIRQNPIQKCLLYACFTKESIMNRSLLKALLLFMIFCNTYPCSCFRTSITKSYNSADIIFIGKLTQIHKADNEFSFRQEYRFVVSKVLKGEAVDTIAIETGMGGGDCGSYFRDSIDYLIYAYKKDKGYTTNICSRSKALSESQIDSVFFEHMPHILSTSSFVGNIYYVRDRSPFINMCDLTVTIRNKEHHYVTKTNSQGNFYFLDIKPGVYTIELAISDSLYLSPYHSSIRIDSLECEEDNYQLSPATFINGKTFFTNGSAAPNIEVSLVESDIDTRNNSVGYFESATSNDSGYFEFDKGITLGAYYLAVNPNGPTVDMPYETTFYPNTPTLNKAIPIELHSPTATKSIRFSLLNKKLPIYLVSGYCYYKDSVPATNVSISFDAIMKYGKDNVTMTTDNQGKFSLKAVHGQKLVKRSYYFQVETKEESEQLQLQHRSYTAEFGLSDWEYDTLQVNHNLTDLKYYIGKTSKDVYNDIRKYRTANRKK